MNIVTATKHNRTIGKHYHYNLANFIKNVRMNSVDPRRSLGQYEYTEAIHLLFVPSYDFSITGAVNTSSNA